MTQVTWQNSCVTQTAVTKGIHFVEVPLNTVVFFVRKGHAVPLAKPASCVDQLSSEIAQIVGDGDSYQLYEDDGFTRSVTLDGHVRTVTR